MPKKFCHLLSFLPSVTLITYLLSCLPSFLTREMGTYGKEFYYTTLLISFPPVSFPSYKRGKRTCYNIIFYPHLTFFFWNRGAQRNVEWYSVLFLPSFPPSFDNESNKHVQQHSLLLLLSLSLKPSMKTRARLKRRRCVGRTTMHSLYFLLSFPSSLL